MKTRGFTLVEIIVVVSIMAILASMVIVGMIQAGQQSRDSQRQADLRLMQNALDLYKNKYGRYPEGCNGANRWSAETVTVSSPHRCSDGTLDYIRNLAPEFIPTLPKEVKSNGDNSGFMYYVNTDGSVFKLVSHQAVESEAVTDTHPFALCDFNDPTNVHGGACARVQWNGQSEAPNCRLTNSYAVWGGFPFEPRTGNRADEVRENVICRVP